MDGISTVDQQSMDVIGYDLAVPEPSSLALLSLSAIGLLLRPRGGWCIRPSFNY